MTAVTTFRPGKRFSVDGLKAYVAIFLAFARRSCPFGLAEALPLAVASDDELADFVSMSHALHDVRDHAVHDGLATKDLAAVQALGSLTGAIANRAQLLR